MGLLDEAIREHLELKRRRGADPGEVAREQREVLNVVPEERVASAGELEGEAVEGDGAGLEAQAPAADQELSDAEPVHPSEAPAPHDAPAGEVAGHTEASTLGEETAELDMQSVLDEGDDPHELSSPAPPRFTDSPRRELGSEPTDGGPQVEDDELSDVYRQVPGQERLSFE